MAFQGSLAELSIPELMQLLSLQQKSGVLTLVHTAGHRHVLFLEHGRILAAADRRSNKRHVFLDYLGQNQILSQEQVATIEDICEESGHELFTILLTSGMMGKERLAEEMHRYAQRIIDELVNWRSGTYEFTGDRENLPAMGLRHRVNPEELVLESMRRSDELSVLKDSMLGPELVLTVDEQAPTESLPRECSVVLDLIDGERPIATICSISPLGEYLTYDAISELLGRQVALVVSPNTPSPVRSRAKRPRLSASALLAAVSLIAGSLLFGSGLAPLLAKSGHHQGWLPQDMEASRAAVHRAMAVDVDRLLTAIED